MDDSIYDQLMQANISRVFNERDPQKRLIAITEIYAADAVMYEPELIANSHQAISDAVTDLQSHLPPDVSFTANGPALGHHGVGRLKWHASAPNGPIIVNGMDITNVKDGLIQTLHVFIEPNT